MFKSVLWVLTLSLLPALAWADEENWEAGKDYDIIAPAERTADPSRIEVAEFFWYGCHHCFNFEPELEAWTKTLPEDAYFRGIPAMWGSPMDLHAKAFYTAEVLKVLDKVSPAMFTALNVDRKRLNTEDAIAEVFVQAGVSREDFDRVFNSFGVDSQVRQADSLARSAKITGTPSMMVDGKYLISPRKAGSYPNMLKIADFLIAKERKARAAAAAPAAPAS